VFQSEVTLGTLTPVQGQNFLNFFNSIGVNFNKFQAENFFLLSFFFITSELLFRWYRSGHPPLSNLYESLLFFIWGLIGFFLFWDFQRSTNYKSVNMNENPAGILILGEKMPERDLLGGSNWLDSPQASFALSGSKTEFSLRNFLGGILSSAALFIETFADWRLPSEMKEMKPLIPALQSNWLLMHVSIMILSYAALLIGCLLAISYIAFSSGNTTEGWAELDRRSTQNWTGIPRPKVQDMTEGPPKTPGQELADASWGSVVGSGQEGVRTEGPESGHQGLRSGRGYGHVGFDSPEVLDKRNETSDSLNFNSPLLDFRSLFLRDLDSLSFRVLAFGFPLLTLGILSGAVWANEAWGSYWSWDPKETWAFITWLIFAFYLHTRLQYGWEGQKSAFVATFGFFILWICYLGVNLLGKGLHSYGWLS
jgi:cytochrome c-type biogenesis protein CcsB